MFWLKKCNVFQVSGAFQCQESWFLLHGTRSAIFGFLEFTEIVRRSNSLKVLFAYSPECPLVQLLGMALRGSQNMNKHDESLARWEVVLKSPSHFGVNQSPQLFGSQHWPPFRGCWNMKIWCKKTLPGKIPLAFFHWLQRSFFNATYLPIPLWPAPGSQCSTPKRGDLGVLDSNIWQGRLWRCLEGDFY